MVDDRSKDGSWQKMKDLHERDGRLKIVRLIRNFGQHNALMCGFNQAWGDYVIIMDDDLQNPPEEIPKLIKKIKEDYSVVYGEYEIKRHGMIENIFSRIFNKLKHNILNIPKDIYTSNFAIMQCDVIKRITSIKTAYPFLSAMIFKSVSSSKITNVKVVHLERSKGKSNYSMIRYISFSLNLLINHSFLPILFIWGIGILATMLGIFLGIITLAGKPLQANFASFAVAAGDYLMICMTLLGGMILISIGIIGEYMRRILNEFYNESQYVIDEMEL